jgi:predicted TIM-barrel fold metal-dependent hydrolase
MRDSEDGFETREEAIIGHLGPEYFEVVQNRLPDCDTIRLQAMDEDARGNVGIQALHCTMLTMGADRILFAADYSYEDYAEGGAFIDVLPIGESDRRKIAYANATALVKL